MNLNELSKRIHAANHTWWHDLETSEPIQRNKGELLALVISELSEALEGERKDLMDDHLPHRKMAEVEMADAVIRLLDYAGGFGIPMPNKMSLPSWWEISNKGASIFELMLSVAQIRSPMEQSWITESILDIESYCFSLDYDLWGALEEKLAYNATRHDHTVEARKAANGKKF